MWEDARHTDHTVTPPPPPGEEEGSKTAEVTKEDGDFIPHGTKEIHK